MLGDHYLYCNYTRRRFLKTAGKSALGIGLLAPSVPETVSAASTKKIHAYIGTYTRRNRRQGIYALTLDPVTGALSNGAPSPQHPTRRIWPFIQHRTCSWPSTHRCRTKNTASSAPLR